MTEKKRISRVNPFAEMIVKSALKVIFKKMFNVKTNMPEEVYNLEPPFVLIPNHQGFWDPFLAGVYFKSPVYYITSDAVFRSKLFGFLLKFLGAIPKTKSQSDLDALKNIFEIKEDGCSIGIFAEGQRTWDGRTLPLIKSTSKLIRMLKIPVVSVVFKGGYFSQPRWRSAISKGQLIIDYKLLFKGDDLGEMKVSEIHNILTEALFHDEIEYQEKMQIDWTGGRNAENIEQFLFTCPSCLGFDGFESNKDRFKCKSCGKEWEISKRQVISSTKGESFFDNVRDWDEWQLSQMREHVGEYFESDKTIFQDSGVVFHTGYKSRKPKFLARGTMKLQSETLTLYNLMGRELVSAPLAEISGINVQNREVLDFYFNSILYTVRDPRKHFNAYKWWRAVDYLQREKLQMNLPV